MGDGFLEKYLRNKPASLPCTSASLILRCLPGCVTWSTTLAKICLDIGHASANSSIVLLEWIRVLASVVCALTVMTAWKISTGRWTGVRNMAAIIEALLDKAGSPTLVLECDPKKESLRYNWFRTGYSPRSACSGVIFAVQNKWILSDSISMTASKGQNLPG